MIYLDNAATTLKKPDGVKEAVLYAMENFASVGRSGNHSAMLAAETVFSARERIGELFGVSNAAQVVFTSNATHALNIAIKGIASPGECVISGYEHNSVLRPIVSNKELIVKVVNAGLFYPEEIVHGFSRSINKNTKLVVCTHMSNVFGYILPIREIDDICYKKGVPLIIDASQSAGSVPISLARLKATRCICMPGHKGLYGPQGTGILLCKDGSEIKPLIEGGTGSVSNERKQPQFMPDRLESGTHNVPGIAGLSEGVKYILERKIENIARYERRLISEIADQLKKMRGITVFATRDTFLQGGVLSFTVEGVSSEEIAEKLNSKEIAVRSGLHCSPLAHECVGTTSGTVRVSVSDFTTEKEVEIFIKTVFEITNQSALRKY